MWPTRLLVLPSINWCKLDRWWTAPLVVFLGTKRIKLDNAIDYQSTTSPFPFPFPKKRTFLLVVNTSNPRILHTLKHIDKFKLHDFKRCCISLYMRDWDLISLTLQNLQRQLSVYIYHLLHRNYYISYCLSCTITINFTSLLHKQCDIP